MHLLYQVWNTFEPVIIHSVECQQHQHNTLVNPGEGFVQGHEVFTPVDIHLPPPEMVNNAMPLNKLDGQWFRVLRCFYLPRLDDCIAIQWVPG